MSLSTWDAVETYRETLSGNKHFQKIIVVIVVWLLGAFLMVLELARKHVLDLFSELMLMLFLNEK